MIQSVVDSGPDRILAWLVRRSMFTIEMESGRGNISFTSALGLGHSEQQDIRDMSSRSRPF